MMVLKIHTIPYQRMNSGKQKVEMTSFRVLTIEEYLKLCNL